MSKSPDTSVEDRDWMNIVEAAKYLHLDRATVRKLIRVGRLDAWQLFPGTRSPYRISKASLERLEKEQANGHG